MHRSKPAQPFVLDVQAFLSPTVDHGLHARGVPGVHDVAEEGMRTGDSNEFVLTPAALWRNASIVDGPLQLVDRLAAVEQGVQFSPEVWIGEVVAQEHRSEKPSKLVGRATTTVTLGGAIDASSDRIAALTWLTLSAGIIAATPLASISVPCASKPA